MHTHTHTHTHTPHTRPHTPTHIHTSSPHTKHTALLQTHTHTSSHPLNCLPSAIESRTMITKHRSGCQFAIRDAVKDNNHRSGCQELRAIITHRSLTWHVVPRTSTFGAPKLLYHNHEPSIGAAAIIAHRSLVWHVVPRTSTFGASKFAQPQDRGSPCAFPALWLPCLPPTSMPPLSQHIHTH